MKTYSPYFIVIALLGLTACETTSYERGVITTELAKVAFKSERDEERFQEIKADIVAVLASDTSITQQLVFDYLIRIDLEFSDAMMGIIRTRLEAELPEVDITGLGKLDDTRIREFLEGVTAAL